MKFIILILLTLQSTTAFAITYHCDGEGQKFRGMDYTKVSATLTINEPVGTFSFEVLAMAHEYKWPDCIHDGVFARSKRS